MTPVKPSPKIKVRKSSSKRIQTLTGIALLIGGIAIGFFIFGNVYESQLYTEIISLILTIIILDRIYQWRAKSHAAQALKDRLLYEASSRSHDVALTAMDWMRNEHWIYGETSLLNCANLERANLERVYLKGASLIQAQLNRVNLRKAYLAHADLRGASLQRANLSYARLMQTNFKQADLRLADLRHADLTGADLRGADLTHAQVSRGTILDDIKIDTHCILPGGIPYEFGSKPIAEQFLYMPDNILNDINDIDEEAMSLDSILDDDDLEPLKPKSRPRHVVRELMMQIHSLHDEELDDLLEQLDIVAHPDMYNEEDEEDFGDLPDGPLAFDGHVDDLLDVSDHEISFLAEIDSALERDKTSADVTPEKSPTFTEDIEDIVDEMDDTSIKFLQNLTDDLDSETQSSKSESTPPINPPDNPTSRSSSNSEQGHP